MGTRVRTHRHCTQHTVSVALFRVEPSLSGPLPDEELAGCCRNRHPEKDLFIWIDRLGKEVNQSTL